MEKRNELNPDRAKILLGDKEMPEERLKRVLERIKAFCKVSYELYAQSEGGRDKQDQEKEFSQKPPDPFI